MKTRRMRGFSIASIWIRALLCAGWVLPQEGASEESISVETCIELLESRSKKTPVREIRFIEERIFPFRSEPAVLEGIARVAPDAGVSLEYPGKDLAMIIDGEGALLRHYGGSGGFRDRRIDRKRAASASLLAATMNFDEATLREHFEMEAEGTPERWTLLLSPRDEAAKLLGIELESDATEVRSIAMRLEADRQIRIEVQEERGLESFSSEERRRYFR